MRGLLYFWFLFFSNYSIKASPPDHLFNSIKLFGKILETHQGRIITINSTFLTSQTKLKHVLKSINEMFIMLSQLQRSMESFAKELTIFQQDDTSEDMLRNAYINHLKHSYDTFNALQRIKPTLKKLSTEEARKFQHLAKYDKRDFREINVFLLEHFIAAGLSFSPKNLHFVSDRSVSAFLKGSYKLKLLTYQKAPFFIAKLKAVTISGGLIHFGALKFTPMYVKPDFLSTSKLKGPLLERNLKMGQSEETLDRIDISNLIDEKEPIRPAKSYQNLSSAEYSEASSNQQSNSSNESFMETYQGDFYLQITTISTSVAQHMTNFHKHKHYFGLLNGHWTLFIDFNVGTLQIFFHSLPVTTFNFAAILSNFLLNEDMIYSFADLPLNIFSYTCSQCNVNESVHSMVKFGLILFHVHTNQIRSILFTSYRLENILNEKSLDLLNSTKKRFLEKNLRAVQLFGMDNTPVEKLQIYRCESAEFENKSVSLLLAKDTSVFYFNFILQENLPDVIAESPFMSFCSSFAIYKYDNAIYGNYFNLYSTQISYEMVIERHKKEFKKTAIR